MLRQDYNRVTKIQGVTRLRGLPAGCEGPCIWVPPRGPLEPKLGRVCGDGEEH